MNTQKQVHTPHTYGTTTTKINSLSPANVFLTSNHILLSTINISYYLNTDISVLMTSRLGIKEKKKDHPEKKPQRLHRLGCGVDKCIWNYLDKSKGLVTVFGSIPWAENPEVVGV